MFCTTCQPLHKQDTPTHTNEARCFSCYCNTTACMHTVTTQAVRTNIARVLRLQASQAVHLQVIFRRPCMPQGWQYGIGVTQKLCNVQQLPGNHTVSLDRNHTQHWDFSPPSWHAFGGEVCLRWGSSGFPPDGLSILRMASLLCCYVILPCGLLLIIKEPDMLLHAPNSLSLDWYIFCIFFLCITASSSGRVRGLNISSSKWEHEATTARGKLFSARCQ